MTLGSIQPPTEMSTRNLPGSKGRLACKPENLTAICEPVIWKTGEPLRLKTLWAFTASYRASFAFHLYHCKKNHLLFETPEIKRQVCNVNKLIIQMQPAIGANDA
jgi:peptidoglycan biosynthesis protein MviN/MurJ (putative lipid II flippase)